MPHCSFDLCMTCAKRFTCKKYLDYCNQGQSQSKCECFIDYTKIDYDLLATKIAEKIDINVDLTAITESLEQINNKLDTIDNEIGEINSDIDIITTNLEEISNEIENSSNESEACCDELNTKLDYIIELCKEDDGDDDKDKLPKITGSKPEEDTENKMFIYDLNKDITQNSISGKFILNLSNNSQLDDETENYNITLRDDNGSYLLYDNMGELVKAVDVVSDNNLYCELQGNKVIVLEVLSDVLKSNGMVLYNASAVENTAKTLVAKTTKGLFGLGKEKTTWVEE